MRPSLPHASTSDPGPLHAAARAADRLSDPRRRTRTKTWQGTPAHPAASTVWRGAAAVSTRSTTKQSVRREGARCSCIHRTTPGYLKQIGLLWQEEYAITAWLGGCRDGALVKRPQASNHAQQRALARPRRTQYTVRSRVPGDSDGQQEGGLLRIGTPHRHRLHQVLALWHAEREVLEQDVPSGSPAVHLVNLHRHTFAHVASLGKARVHFAGQA